MTSTDVSEEPTTGPPDEPPHREANRTSPAGALLAAGVIVAVVAITVLSFDYLRDADTSKVGRVVMAILLGGVGV